MALIGLIIIIYVRSIFLDKENVQYNASMKPTILIFDMYLVSILTPIAWSLHVYDIFIINYV